MENKIQTFFTHSYSYNSIDQFHCFASLPYSFASYFVTLVLKVKSLSHLCEFRLTFLVLSLYKVVPKVLVTTRLGLVMLVDGVMDVNEVIDLTKRTKKTYLIFLVFFKKA